MTEPLNLINFTWEQIQEKIKSNQPFTFVRYGDGDIQCMLGNSRNTMNCDKHMYFPGLGKKLQLSFVCAPLKENYMVSLQSKMLTDMGRQIYAFIENNRMARLWYYADCMHDASAEGRFYDSFVSLTKDDSIACYIGPKRFESVCHNFIEIPSLNCWLQYERTKAMAVDMVLKGVTRFYASASMLTKVLFFEMYEMFADEIQQIDLGSVLEPYVGVSNRRYHEKVLEGMGK